MTKKMTKKMTKSLLNTLYSPVERFFMKFSSFFSRNFRKFFAEILTSKKTLLVGRKIFVFQAPHLVWRCEISMKSALWSPFSAHLYDSPPSHNFFQTGFRLKFSSSEKILDSYIPKSAHFSQKKKISPVS